MFILPISLDNFTKLAFERSGMCNIFKYPLLNSFLAIQQTPFHCGRVVVIQLSWSLAAGRSTNMVFSEGDPQSPHGRKFSPSSNAFLL